MNFYHDPVRHLKYLRQSLSQNSEPIGFLLSAGCPLSVSMPEGLWPLIPDVQNLTLQITEALSGSKDYLALLQELEKAGKDTANVEDILSFLRSLTAVARGGEVRGFSEDTLMSIETQICGQIVEKLDVELPDLQSPYHRLCSWVRSIERNTAVEFFTTNYDLLLEQALEDLEIPYFDGFVGARRSFFDLRALEETLIPNHWSRLWKIHGSINWYQEEVRDEQKVFRASDVKEGAAHLIYPSHLKYDESRKMPFLALTDQLNRFIRRKSSFLVLCGYSFNDTHINNTIESALRANPTGMVLALMHGEYLVKNEEGDFVDRYPKAYRLAERQHNLNVWTFDEAIIGTNQSAWKRGNEADEEDREICEFVASVQNDETLPAKDNVQLGDFAKFSDFLGRMITVGSRAPDA